MKRGLRNGVAPYIPVAFCRDAGSAGHGATEAARPERSLQARGFASGMEARQGGDSFAGSVHDSRPARGTPGKDTARRTTKQTGIRAAVIRVRTGGKRE
uniref:Prepilin peptidase-dependent protein YgdA n=1 Tax=Escherichia coli TaxID=562 RepID=A0A222ZDQ7_ECOLX|nr:Putative prepilin peptidase-dependent protein YgdA [Escherichia coli]